MDKHTEQLISSERVFEGRLLCVRVDNVRLADGREAKREIVEHPGAVAIVPLLGEEVILVHQWRQALGRVTLEIPAGTLSPGEPPEDCARRELAEETGSCPGRLTRLAAVALTPGYSTEIIHLFLAEELSRATARQDVDENVSVSCMPLREAVQRCAAGEFQDAKTIIGLLLAWHRLRGEACEGLAAPG